MTEVTNTTNCCDAASTEERTEYYEKLIDYGISEKTSVELDRLFSEGKMSFGDLDDRALDALKEFEVEGGVCVLRQLASDGNLEHVSNKSAYLCGAIKTYRQKLRLTGNGAVSTIVPVKGPDEEKLNALLERTGYSLEITTGQRKYGGPPPDWPSDSAQPPAGSEVFVGKVPKDMFEDELVPLFEQCGRIWDLRLMMDPLSGANRGYAFIKFCGRDGAETAVKMYDNHEVKKGKILKVNISVANQRLFVGNIPKSKTRDEILDEFEKIASGLIDVIIYASPDDQKKKNRGFAFLEYDTHKSASLANKKLGTGRIKVWGCDILVDWADPVEEPDEETMARVKVAYVRNLKESVTEEALRAVFEAHGKVEKVKKMKDYAFVHFEEREHALNAIRIENGREMDGVGIDVSLAKPPTKKKKEQKLMRQMAAGHLHQVGGGNFPGPFPGGPDPYANYGATEAYNRAFPPPHAISRGRRPPHPLGYEYGYGYGDFYGGYLDYYEDYFGPYEELGFAEAEFPRSARGGRGMSVAAMRGGNRGGGRGSLRGFPMMPSGVGNCRGGVIGGGRGIHTGGGGRGGTAVFAVVGGRGGEGRGARGPNGALPSMNNIDNNVHAQNGNGNGVRRSVDGITTKETPKKNDDGDDVDSTEAENRWYNDIAL